MQEAANSRFAISHSLLIFHSTPINICFPLKLINHRDLIRLLNVTLPTYLAF